MNDHPLAMGTTIDGAQMAPLDTDFDTRWAAWVLAYEARVRRTRLAWASILTAGASIIYLRGR